jgi:hypothetical protein
VGASNNGKKFVVGMVMVDRNTSILKSMWISLDLIYYTFLMNVGFGRFRGSCR